MTKKIVFDLDGVLRDLSGSLCRKLNLPYPTTWHWNAIDLINEDLSILEEAIPTVYFRIIRDYFDEIEVWTSQPVKWRPYTKRWLYRFLGDKVKKTVFVGNPLEKEKLLEADKSTFLMEDYPHFKSYERIILLSYPYNKEVEAKVRLKSLRELEMFCRKLPTSRRDNYRS
ncbi:MAG: hypothetical protein KAU20_05600 [Nanoarchaeota archaeon]|nr:hypothetical protein [Nanoarchaeota archaeon]